jgi:MFS superfamily sulfate permease-like transporter
MAAILLYGADYIQYLPVPVLAAIVIDALINACEFELAARLRRVSRADFRIFVAAFCGVLLFGTVYGVVIGVVLSFIAVTVRSVDPPRGFLGVVPGEKGFYSLSRNHDAESLPDTILYRFSGNLFFANIDLFQDDIENALAAAPSSKQVIVNAGGIGMIDITAADRLVLLYRSLQKRGIRFYITEHAGDLNDQLRLYGAEELLQNGVLQMTVELALEDAGITMPYTAAAKEPAARTSAGGEKTGPTAQAPEQAAEEPADSAGGSAQQKWMFGDEDNRTEEGEDEKNG